MKYTLSEQLTIADLKTEDYKLACQWAKELNEKNFADNVCFNGNLLKIISVEIVRNKGVVVPWVVFYTESCNAVCKIGANGYDSDDNYTIHYVRA